MSDESPIKWANDEDRQLAALDQCLYGTCFMERGDSGLYRRVDPARVLTPTMPTQMAILAEEAREWAKQLLGEWPKGGPAE